MGIAIGGSKTAVSLANFDGENLKVLNKISFKTNPSSDKDTIEQIFLAIDSFKAKFDVISIICGGPLDIEKGTIENPPHLNGFKGTPIVDIFTRKYNCKTYLLNDADASAYAEYLFGAGKNSKNMAYCTFGTGFGAGLILNNKLYTGNNGMAGEIGHVKISDNGPIGYDKVGSVEGWCAGGNIYKWAGIGKISSTKELFELARNNDSKAKEAIATLDSKLGEALSVLNDTLNLDTIVLGGIYPRNLDLLEEKVKLAFKENSLPSNYINCKILPSKLGENIDEYSSLMGYFANEDCFSSFYKRYPKLISQKENIEEAINILYECYKNKGKILVCGNGGSSSDSSHIVGELMKGFLSKRELPQSIKDKLDKEFDSNYVSSKLQIGIPCIDLCSQQALLTAFSNDVDPELIFAQEVLGYSSKNTQDVLIGISTSGNSKNVVNALKVAKAIGMKSIALTGKNESKSSEVATICIKAPEEETYKIQEYHLPIYHYICMELEKRVIKYELK